jgi:hypothetical protein
MHFNERKTCNATPAASEWPDVVHKPNLFVEKRFGRFGNALAWEILPRGANVPNSDNATSRMPACGSSACRSSTGGKPIRGSSARLSSLSLVPVLWVRTKEERARQRQEAAQARIARRSPKVP